MTAKSLVTRFTVAAAAAALCALPLVLSADSVTSTLNVSASVSARCTIATTSVTFNPYDPVVDHASTPLDATGTLDVACTKGLAPAIGLDDGGNASEGIRRLKSGDNYLPYSLFKDSARSIRWGNEGADRLLAEPAKGKAARTFTVYGRIAAGLDVPTGSYSDLVTVTVNF